ncbi:MAG: hypothetical protein IPP29_21190 [Bacteroidetes bacterium]|nr:hypothetical protein [Bacteroidota bacterium]
MLDGRTDHPNLSGIGRSHTVTVKDAGGCTISLCVVLTQPNAIVVSVSTKQAAMEATMARQQQRRQAAQHHTVSYGVTEVAQAVWAYLGTYTVTLPMQQDVHIDEVKW